jgi:hypothetical protein
MNLVGPHPSDQPNCKYCKVDANMFNHCAYCGAFLRTSDRLAAHMDDGCFDAILAGLFGVPAQAE